MTSIITVVLFAAIVICVFGVLYFLIRWLKEYLNKIETEKKQNNAKETLMRLDSLINASVVSTNYQMVDKLKSSNEFFQLDKEEAFAITREKIEKCMNLNKLKNDCNYINDIDEWINSRIEYYVYNNNI